MNFGKVYQVTPVAVIFGMRGNPVTCHCDLSADEAQEKQLKICEITSTKNRVGKFM